MATREGKASRNDRAATERGDPPAHRRPPSAEKPGEAVPWGPAHEPSRCCSRQPTGRRGSTWWGLASRTAARTGERSMTQVAEELREYLPGWRNYFGLAETPTTLADQDKWIRHRLRSPYLKQWKRGPTTYRELRARASTRWAPEARSVTSTSRTARCEARAPGGVAGVAGGNPGAPMPIMPIG